MLEVLWSTNMESNTLKSQILFTSPMSYYINIIFNMIIKWFVIIKKGEIVGPKVSNYSFDDNKALDNQMFRLMAFKCWV